MNKVQNPVKLAARLLEGIRIGQNVYPGLAVTASKFLWAPPHTLILKAYSSSFPFKYFREDP